MAKILIIDDEEDIVFMLATRLGVHRHVVSSATNGKEGLEKVAEDKPDLILLDIMMPVMDGIETLARLKSDAQTAHIPVIMFTAKSSKSDIERALAGGAQDFVTKPFTAEELMTKIHRTLGESGSATQPNDATSGGQDVAFG